MTKFYKDYRDFVSSREYIESLNSITYRNPVKVVLDRGKYTLEELAEEMEFSRCWDSSSQQLLKANFNLKLIKLWLI